MKKQKYLILFFVSVDIGLHASIDGIIIFCKFDKSFLSPLLFECKVEEKKNSWEIEDLGAYKAKNKNETGRGYENGK